MYDKIIRKCLRYKAVQIWLHIAISHGCTICTVQKFEVTSKITHVFKKFSNSSAKLSPTASLTTGTSPFICPLALFLLCVLVVAASSIASSASSPNVSASAVLRGVDCPFVLGCGALLGGNDERGATGDDEGSKFIAVVVLGWRKETKLDASSEMRCDTTRLSHCWVTVGDEFVPRQRASSGHWLTEATICFLFSDLFILADVCRRSSSTK